MDAAILVIIVLVVLMLAGVPLVNSFILACFLGITMLGLDSRWLVSASFYGINSFVMVAAPLFIMLGNIMDVGGMTDKLVGLVNDLMRGIRGSLGLAVIGASVVFGAISGSSGATVAAIGTVMVPQMTKQGYDKRYSAALISASGILGILIPPSIPLIIYGAVAGASVAKLFLGGVVPGLVLAAFYAIVNQLMCRRKTVLAYPRPGGGYQAKPAKQIARDGGRALPVLFLPVIVLGGIYGGIFTPTEAAAIAVVYAIVIGALFYRRLNIKNFIKAIIESANTTAVILIIFALAIAFTRIMTVQQVPMKLASGLLGITENTFLILLLLDVLILMLGMFLDPITGTIIVAPMLMPLMLKLGVDPVHFGIILCVGFGVGLLTPPVAYNLYIGARICELSLSSFFKQVIPFFGAATAVLMLVTFIPELSLFLPGLYGK